MQLPWQNDEGRGEGGAMATVDATPTRTRRWRRLVTPRRTPAPAAPVADGDGRVDVAGSPREPGIVAVAIARVLVAIDFALRGR